MPARGGRRNIVTSEDENENQQQLEQAHTEERRPKRSSKPTYKIADQMERQQSEKDKENEKLKQLLIREKKKTERLQETVNTFGADHMPPESEEEEEEEPSMMKFSSSIRSKGLVTFPGSSAAKPPLALRKEGSSRAPAVSRQAVQDSTARLHVPQARTAGNPKSTPATNPPKRHTPHSSQSQTRNDVPRTQSQTVSHRTSRTSSHEREEEPEEAFSDDPSTSQQATPFLREFTPSQFEEPESPRLSSSPAADYANRHNKRPRSSSHTSRSPEPTQDLPPAKKKSKKSGTPSNPLPPLPPLTKVTFVGGAAPTGRRDKLADYNEPFRGIILRIMQEYEARIIAVDAFPDSAKQLEWVGELWEQNCAKAELNVDLETRIVNLVKKRGSHARGAIKDRLRPLIAPHYGLKSSEKAKVQAANKKMSAELLTQSSFHYQDTEARSEFLRNEIIMNCIREAIFKNKSAVGVEFPTYFASISISSLALICTLIHFCLNEWASGRYQQAEFVEVNLKSQYIDYIKLITDDWHKLNPEVVTKYRTKLAERGRRFAGVVPKADGMVLTAKAKKQIAQELAAHTGDTDSEEDGDSEEDELENVNDENNGGAAQDGGIGGDRD